MVWRRHLSLAAQTKLQHGVLQIRHVYPSGSQTAFPRGGGNVDSSVSLRNMHQGIVTGLLALQEMRAHKLWQQHTAVSLLNAPLVVVASART
jgi:hypothetical protein